MRGTSYSRITRQELAHALTMSRPDCVIVDENQLSKLEIALQSIKATITLPHQQIYVLQNAIQPEKSKSGRKAFDLPAAMQSDCRSFKPSKYSRHESACDPAFICFSSGTTGLVKGVQLSHRNIVANIFQHMQALEGDFDSDSVCTLVLPFFHILGLAVLACQYVCQVSPGGPLREIDGMLESHSKTSRAYLSWCSHASTFVLFWLHTNEIEAGPQERADARAELMYHSDTHQCSTTRCAGVSA